jgi:D-alanyl-D-alanine carboxypeptidase
MRIRRGRVARLLVAVATVAIALVYRWPASSPSTTSTSPSSSLSAAKMATRPPTPGSPIDELPKEHRGAFGPADGAVPDGATVFDDAVPGVANLDAGLRRALRRAAGDAGQDGVAFVVDSGWRSRAYQQRLLDQAVAKYGSREEAARWVATPSTSAHVSGDAIDIGPNAAAAWLSAHGATYGLCQIYHNEPWHYELRPKAVARGCPVMYSDPTQDPRLQR